ncbi:MAG: sortase [Candidatus Saccharimonadales bacterium]
MKTIDPPAGPTFQLPDEPADNDGSNQAADFIRAKLNSIYNSEPDVVTEAIETAIAPETSRSKHQRYMADLSSSGKPFAIIQMEWHEYYKSLPDKEKHEVWEEFYAARGDKPLFRAQAHVPFTAPSSPLTGSFEPATAARAPKKSAAAPQSVADIKTQILGRIRGRGKLSHKAHLKSLAFGLGMGGLVVTVLLFGFFNERFIAPFITPSRNVSSTPLIMDAGKAVGTESKIIIPKINVEVPVVYDVVTVEEKAVQSGLERGVVHYATTSNPGEQGGGAIFGHSSNNLLNKGKYKFAFVLLSRMEKDDTFYIEKGGVRYVYRIFDKRIVSPTDISVLDSVPGKTSTLALITCDPPGTTINRLVVWGEQISPDPVQNVASTAVKTDAQADRLAGNPQSLWSRIWGSIF